MAPDDQPTPDKALHELVAAHGKTREDVDRLNYAVFGIPGTEEKGLLGESRETNNKLDRTNDKLDEIRNAILLFALGLVGTALTITAAVVFI